MRRVPAGIRRSAPASRPIDGLGAEELERAIAAQPDDAMDRRDRALLLLGRDLDVLGDGSGRVTIARSKTDQEGTGAVLYVTPRTVAALADWTAPEARDADARSSRTCAAPAPTRP